MPAEAGEKIPSISNAALPGGERRGGQRMRAYKAGKIISVDLGLTFDCLVRDQSPTGARIAIDRALGVPGEFYFYLPTDRLVAKAKVVWRGPKQIGITYLEPLIHPAEHPNRLLKKVTIF